MAAPTQASSPPCSDKHNLIEDIRLAMRTISGLNDREMAAAVASDFHKLAALRAELEEARAWKYSIIDEYEKHVREHGC